MSTGKCPPPTANPPATQPSTMMIPMRDMAKTESDARANT
jgi:hypothetical protein